MGSALDRRGVSLSRGVAEHCEQPRSCFEECADDVPQRLGAAEVLLELMEEASVDDVLTPESLGSDLTRVGPPPMGTATLERSAKLPEELGEALRDVDARVFRELSGTSDLLKGLWVRLLGPFAHSPLVFLRVCVAAPTQRSMREELVARVRTITNGDDERLAGLDRLVRVAVERQALRAQRLLVAGLRGVAFAHVVVVCALAALVVLHVIAEIRAW